MPVFWEFLFRQPLPNNYYYYCQRNPFFISGKCASLFYSSCTHGFQYLYQTHRFLRALQVLAHFSYRVLSRTKWRLRIPRVGDLSRRGAGQALKSFDGKSTQKDTLPLIMRIKSPRPLALDDVDDVELTQPLVTSSTRGNTASHWNKWNP